VEQKDMANGYLTPWRRGSLTGAPSFGAGSLFDLHRQMNQLFDDLVERGPGAGLGAPALAATGWPQLEIEQDGDRIRVVAELPGVNEDDIELTVEDGVLSLSGEKRSERKDENGYSERSYGRFERRIALPSNIDEEACSADFKNGVLTVTIPRAEEKARGRRIPLGQGGGQSARRIEAQNDAEEGPRQEAAEESGQSERPDNQQG
jgi:HSP20 family protein